MSNTRKLLLLIAWIKIFFCCEHVWFCILIGEFKRSQLFFNRLFRTTRNKTSEFCITGPLWGESTSDWWIPLTKGQSYWKCFNVMTTSNCWIPLIYIQCPVMRKTFSCHDIIIIHQVLAKVLFDIKNPADYCVTDYSNLFLLSSAMLFPQWCNVLLHRESLGTASYNTEHGVWS